MILADTSVWVDYFRSGDTELARQLRASHISIHPFVITELALGALPDRARTIRYLELLPVAKVAQTEEVRRMIEAHLLFRRGIGFVDAHLIASVFLTPRTFLWSRDKRLHEVAERLGVGAGLG